MKNQGPRRLSNFIISSRCLLWLTRFCCITKDTQKIQAFADADFVASLRPKADYSLLPFFIHKNGSNKRCLCHQGVIQLP